jgi:hypothetical protein
VIGWSCDIIQTYKKKNTMEHSTSFTIMMKRSAAFMFVMSMFSRPIMGSDIVKPTVIIDTDPGGDGKNSTLAVMLISS